MMNDKPYSAKVYIDALLKAIDQFEKAEILSSLTTTAIRNILLNDLNILYNRNVKITAHISSH